MPKIYYYTSASFAVRCRCPQWTKDEKVCARNVNNEILFYEDNNFSKLSCFFNLNICVFKYTPLINEN